MELQQQIQTFIELTNEYEQLFSQLTFGEESNFEENNHLELRSLLHLVVELQEDVIEFRLKKIITLENPYLSRIDIEKVRQRTTQCQPSFQQLSTIFKSQRSEVARLLQSIPISNWLRYGLLEGEGHVTFRELIRRYFEFDRDFFQMLKEYVQQNEWISFD